ncbi:MAG: class I SAM-dependent methyltransferase [Bifidobacteriaceae bacterium]|jgi:SAM-dependent methyltransferase|nr:class I SAM-dependent methyltransferase [Bifidobacteriaceae bacterium]
MAQPEPVESFEARAVARSFGENAAAYDKARPGYPPRMIQAVVAQAPGPAVLDVGIGTGIAAVQLRAAGARVSGVEVDARMAELARAKGFPVDVARFEDWDPAGRRFDAVTAAQTWHWIDPAGGAAAAARALVPGGLLALWWNVYQPPAPLAARFAAVYKSIDTGLPFTPYDGDPLAGYDHIAALVTGGLAAAGRFGSMVRADTSWTIPYTTAEWLAFVPTTGGHSRMAPAAQAAVLDGLGRVVDDAGGSFTLDVTTVLLTARRV